jgi:glutathione S-transferase
MARLFLLHYSPWSEKARWALDHHRVAYQRVDHVPMLGEPRLRLAAGRLRGRVSVPLFVDGDLVLGDSLDIARHAERVGTGDPLFPAGKERAIERWNTLSNDLAGAARGRVIAGTIADRDAQRGALPRGLPSFLAPMAATGASFLARKYAARDEGASAVARMRALLDEVRAALGGRRYVFDSLSYADIAVAAAMQAVSPVADRHLPLAAATRRVWKDETLARDFSDLVQWRDDLYDRHRR